MASQLQFMQHNWTGLFAIFATVPKHPLLAHAVKGVSNSKARGTWLKAASHARLRLNSSLAEPSSIEIHLGAQPLLACPLSNQKLSMKLLPDSSTSSGNLLIITPKQQSKTAALVHYCFQFFDEADCNSFQLALETLKSKRASKLLQQQHQQEQQQDTQAQQQRDDLVTYAPGCQATSLIQAKGMDACRHTADTQLPTAAGKLASGQALGEHQMHLASAQQTSVKDLIKQYMLDPSFHAYVDKIDALWDEVEQELIDQDGTVAAIQPISL